jgi:hypothetical protein
MDDVDVERILTDYYAMCEQAGVEPLPDDEAREKARVMLDVLAPAFEVELRRH